MIKYITSNDYNVLSEDTHIKCSNGIGASKVTLPSARINEGKSIMIEKVDSSANAVTIHVQRDDVLSTGVKQVETATVVGTVTGDGNATVVVTSANIATSPITVSVAVLTDDTATIVAGKIAVALRQNEFIGNGETGLFTVTNSGATVVLTCKDYYANDATLNVSIDNGTCTGLTTAATSTNTTAGVNVTLTVQNDYKTFTSDGAGWTITDYAVLATTQTLANKTLTTPVIASFYQDAAKTKLMTTPDTASDTLVTLAATQVLTNKRLTSPKINEDVVLTATATQLNEAGSKASSACRLYNLGAPIVADDDKIVVSADMKVGTYTVAAQPDVPRNITVTVTAGSDADTMGTITVAGTNYADAVISEVITPVAGSAVAGKKAFKTVTTVTGAGWVIDAGETPTADAIKVGIGNEIGLPIALDAAAEIMLGILDTTITAHNPTVSSGTATIEETTIDMSSGTYDGSKVAYVFVVD